MQRTHPTFGLWAAAVVAAINGTAGAATDYAWTGGTGNWDSPAKWSPAGTPGSAAGDTVTIDAPSTYTVSLNVNPANALAGLTLNNADATLANSSTRTLTIDGPAVISAGTLTMTTAFTINGSGTLTNHDTILVTSGSNNINLAFEQAGTMLIQNVFTNNPQVVVANGFDNSGTITLSTIGASVVTARLTVTSGALTNTAAGVLNFNVGDGVGNRQLIGDLVNHGAVNVNYTTTFSKTGGQYTNYGAFTIASGASLSVLNNGVFTQAGGVLDIQGTLQAGPTFNFTGGTITGNSVLVGGGAVNIGPSAGAGAFTFQSTANTLSGNVNAGQSLLIRGVTGQHATVTAASGFTNAGLITLRTENAGNDARLVVTSGTLVNDVGGTIEILGDAVNAGSRELRATIDNRGLIRHDYASQLTFFGQLTPTVHVNSGVIDIAAGGMRMRAGNALTNQVSGTISGSGTLHVLDGTFINEGKIAPGNSAGILSVTGSVTNTASSVLSIELGGLTVGTQYDRLAISGTIAIDGTLDVRFVNGFEHAITAMDTFTVLTAASRTGFFVNATPVSGNTATAVFGGVHQFDVTYTANSVLLGNYMMLVIPEPASALITIAGALVLSLTRPRSRAKG